MKLPREFIRLPLDFDAARMAAEVEALPGEAWQAHPTGFKGNSAVPLISVDGGQNDTIAGPMAETPWLKQSPYLRQVLAAFGVVFGRSRLMALAGGAEVPLHCDVNYHWFTRVRIHVPVVTFPEVEFHCADQVVNMSAGEAWIFDNWKMHRVVNPTAERRVHLVADTAGSAAFWQMVDAALEQPDAPRRTIDFDPEAETQLLTERHNAPEVMPPGEILWLAEDLLEDLEDAEHGEQGRGLARDIRAFCNDWRALWALHGDTEPGRGHFERLRAWLLNRLKAYPEPLPLASNGRPAQSVLVARILIPALRKPIPGLKTL